MSTRTRLFPAVLASFLAAGVAALPSADAAPKRPIVDELHTFSYGELPLLEQVLFAPCTRSYLKYGPEKHYGSMPTVKPPSPPSRWTIEGMPADANLRIGTGHYVSSIPLYPKPRLTEAEWVVLDRANTNVDRASISRCTTRAKQDTALTAETSENGVASALIPGRVYAYRRCVAACDQPLGSEARIEELGVVTSPALWVASSDWGANGYPSEDSFGRGFATVRPGTTATIVVGLPPHDASVGVLRSAKGTTGADTFDIEVVWPEGGEPTMTVFSGHVAGASEALAVGR